MKYYRLLKDSPEAPAGTVFKESNNFGNYEPVENLDSFDGLYYTVHTVEDKPEWFEPVDMIAVRPYNKAKLVQLDGMMDENTEAYPIEMTMPQANKLLTSTKNFGGTLPTVFNVQNGDIL